MEITNIPNNSAIELVSLYHSFDLCTIINCEPTFSKYSTNVNISLNEQKVNITSNYTLRKGSKCVIFMLGNKFFRFDINGRLVMIYLYSRLFNFLLQYPLGGWIL